MARSRPQRLPLAQRRGLVGQVYRQWAWVVCMGGMLVGLGLIVGDYWRRGTALIGAMAVLAALLRWLLSDRAGHLLQVRRRAFDALWLATVGVGIMLLAYWVPPIGVGR